MDVPAWADGFVLCDRKNVHMREERDNEKRITGNRKNEERTEKEEERRADNTQKILDVLADYDVKSGKWIFHIKLRCAAASITRLLRQFYELAFVGITEQLCQLWILSSRTKVS